MNAVIKVLVPTTCVLAIAAGGAILAQSPAAKPGVTITVAETAGMRRTEFPVRATVALAQRALAGSDAATHMKLVQADAEVPAQYTVMSSWPDESAKGVDVDFNASLAPGETRSYRLEYGADVTSTQRPRGLTVTDSADAIQIGNIKFNKSGSPLVASANYRGEFIGQGVNGFAVLDADGTRHDLSTAADLKVDIVKRGPLVAVVQYSGRLTIDASNAVPFTLTLEMPNSKSWLKSSAEITDRSGRAHAVRFDTPFALGAFPWLWDIATANGTYGVFRTAQDAATFTQIINQPGSGGGGDPARARGPASSPSQWHVETTARGQLQPYETSTAANRVSDGWGHFQGSSQAVAFGVDRFRTSPGTFTVSLNGQGQASWTFVAPASPGVRRLTIYQHFVATPVPIGAATSPSSMLQPPTVTVTTK